MRMKSVCCPPKPLFLMLGLDGGRFCGMRLRRSEVVSRRIAPMKQMTTIRLVQTRMITG